MAGFFRAVVWRAPRIDLTSVVGCLACSLAFTLWTPFLAAPIPVQGWCFLVLLPWILFLLGRNVMAVLNVQTSPVHPFPLAFLLGSIIGSLLLFALDCFAPLTMRGNCVVLLLVAVVWNALLPDRIEVAPDRRHQWLAGFALFLTLASATLWTQHLRPYLAERGTDQIFRPLPDGLTHAHFIGLMMTDPPLWQLGNADFSGLSIPLYHYVIYVPTAAFATWLEQSALDSVYAFFIPFGLVLTGLAAFCLGNAWWGPAAGLASLVGVMMIPDASTHGLRIMWLSYHYFIIISPGLNYGTATMAVALLLVTRGIQPIQWPRIAFGFGLALSSIVIKAQIFFVGVPLLVAWFLLFKQDWSWRWRAGIGLGLACAGLGTLLVADRLGLGPAVLPFGRSFGVTFYWRAVYELIRAPAWKELLSPLATADTFASYPLHAFVLVVGGCFGALLLFTCFVYVLAGWRRHLERIDALPLLAFGIFLVSVFFLARNDRGHPDEMRHRQFVWMYFLLAVWSWGKLTALLGTLPRVTEVRLTAAVAIFGLLALAHPWRVGTVIDRVRASWHERDLNMPLPRGLVECCQYVRRESLPEDVIQGKPREHFSVIGGLCERRCYLSRSAEFWAVACPGSPIKEESARRDEILQNLRAATTSAELQRLARLTGIRWYLTEPEDKLAWPADILAAPAFQSGEYKVYDLTAVASATVPAASSGS